MRPVLIDSDILIEVLRARNLAVLSRWAELSSNETAVLCSPISVAELWHGARPKEHTVIEAMFSEIQCVPVDYQVARRAGEYLRDYAKSHHLELADTLIAATCSIHNLELWTRNRRHYPVKDLRFF